MFSFRSVLSLLAIPLIGSVIFGVPAQVRADFQFTWSANAYLADDSTNSLLSIGASAGSVAISGTALGDNVLGTAGTAVMDLSTITLTASAPGSVTLYLTQNGLSSPLGQGVLVDTLTGHFITGSGSVSMVAYGNDTNYLYGNNSGMAPEGGTTPLVSGLGNVATSAVALGGSASTEFIATNPYSMTEIITVTFTGSGSVSLSSDGSTTFANPAPASLILLLSALPLMLGLGYFFRRRSVIALPA